MLICNHFHAYLFVVFRPASPGLLSILGATTFDACGTGPVLVAHRPAADSLRIRITALRRSLWIGGLLDELVAREFTPIFSPCTYCLLPNRSRGVSPQYSSAPPLWQPGVEIMRFQIHRPRILLGDNRSGG